MIKEYQLDEIVRCRYCGDPTSYLGNRLCNTCWNLGNGIRNSSPYLIMKIIKAENPKVIDLMLLEVKNR